jgi:hypothetical protein
MDATDALRVAEGGAFAAGAGLAGEDDSFQ